MLAKTDLKRGQYLRKFPPDHSKYSFSVYSNLHIYYLDSSAMWTPIFLGGRAVRERRRRDIALCRQTAEQLLHEWQRKEGKTEKMLRSHLISWKACVKAIGLLIWSCAQTAH